MGVGCWTARSPSVEIRKSGGDARFVFFSGSGRITGLVSAHALSSMAIEMVLEQRGIRPTKSNRARGAIGAHADGDAPLGELGTELHR